MPLEPKPLPGDATNEHHTLIDTYSIAAAELLSDAKTDIDDWWNTYSHMNGRLTLNGLYQDLMNQYKVQKYINQHQGPIAAHRTWILKSYISSKIVAYINSKN